MNKEKILATKRSKCMDDSQRSENANFGLITDWTLTKPVWAKKAEKKEVAS